MALDIGPATAAVTKVVLGVTDRQLPDPTPCTDSTVADLLDHLSGLSLAFTWAAEKDRPDGGSPGPSADGSRLGDDWREVIPERLDVLAAAWREPSA